MQTKFLNPLTFSFRLVCAFAVFVAVSACASGGVRSSLPIITTCSTGGHVDGARAFESADHLYVTGSLEKVRGRHIPHPAHVDVQLVDATGRVLAEKRDDIAPSHPRSASGKSGRYNYVVSFPIPEARHASKIVIRYHLEPHRS